MKWIRCRLGKRWALCYSVALFLLFGLGLLFPSSSVSAYTLSTAVKDHITGVVFTVPGLLKNTQSTGPGGSGIEFDTRRTSNADWGGATIYLAVNVETTIPANSVVSVSMSVSHANSSDAPVCFTGDWGIQVIDCEVSGDNTNNTITGLFYTTRAIDTLILYSYNHAPNITLGTPAIVISSVVFSSVQSESGALTASDISAIKQDIHYIVNNTDVVQNGVRSRLDDIISALNTLDTSAIVNAQNQTNTKLDQQISLQEEANEQQQEQYEAEKQEESDREDSQSESADQLAGIFNFSLSNPFSALLNLFNNGSSCVNIPTLSSWLHTEQTQVCSFFPSSVISVVTPVLSISSMMLLFGFFVRWLNGSSGDMGITVKGGFK